MQWYTRVITHVRGVARAVRTVVFRLQQTSARTARKRRSAYTDADTCRVHSARRSRTILSRERRRTHYYARTLRALVLRCRVKRRSSRGNIFPTGFNIDCGEHGGFPRYTFCDAFQWQWPTTITTITMTAIWRRVPRLKSVHRSRHLLAPTERQVAVAGRSYWFSTSNILCGGKGITCIHTSVRRTRCSPYENENAPLLFDHAESNAKTFLHITDNCRYVIIWCQDSTGCTAEFHVNAIL